MLKLNIEYSNHFKKDYRLAKRRGLDLKRLEKVISMLAQGQVLPPSYHDHLLTDSKQYINVRECHIAPDWLLIYQINKNKLILRLMRMGTHSDVF